MGLGPFMPHGVGPGYTTSNTPPPSQPPYVPTFRTDAVGTSALGGTWKPSPVYFATQETADYMAMRFGALGTVSVPPFPPGSTYAINVDEIHLIFSGGVQYNAGLLAQAFVLYPEDKDPGVADRYIRQAIANLQAKAAGGQ